MTNFESISNEEIKNEDPENRVWTRFVCLSSMDNSQLHDLASEVREQAEEVRSPFEVFISGLKSVNHIVCLPFSLTASKKFEVARQAQFLRLIHHHELQTPQQNYKCRDDWVAEIKRRTQHDMKADKYDAKFEDRIEELTHAVSNEILNFPDVDTVSRGLRYQAAVSLWSCVETLLKDHLKSMFNKNPNLVKLIDEDEKLKKEIGLDRIDSGSLLEYGFDLKQSMGTLIFRNPASGKLGNLRSLLGLIYQQDDLSTRLKSGPLYELNLKRNLIVHNSGVCDVEYHLRSASNVPVGLQIDVTPGELVKLYQTLSEYAGDLLAAAQAVLAHSSPVNANLNADICET